MLRVWGAYIWRGLFSEFYGIFAKPNRNLNFSDFSCHRTLKNKRCDHKCKVACELEKVLFPDKRNISLPYIFCNEKVHVSSAHVHRAFSLRACLHGGGGPQVGEVTRLGGVTRLSI